MINTGKCPKCEKRINHVSMDSIDIGTLHSTWKGLSYVCPHCHSVLGVQIDPVALKNDCVSEIIEFLEKKRR